MVGSSVHDFSTVVVGIEKLSKGVVSDPVADLLVCLRHGQERGLPRIYTPASSLKRGILTVLRDEGFLRSFSELPYQCRFSSEASALSFVASEEEGLEKSLSMPISSRGVGQERSPAVYSLPYSLFPLVRWRRRPLVHLFRRARAKSSFAPSSFPGGRRPWQKTKPASFARKDFARRDFSPARGERVQGGKLPFGEFAQKGPQSVSGKHAVPQSVSGKHSVSGKLGGLAKAPGARFGAAALRTPEQRVPSKEQPPARATSSFVGAGNVAGGRCFSHSTKSPFACGKFVSSFSRLSSSSTKAFSGKASQGRSGKHSVLNQELARGVYQKGRTSKPRYLAACYQYFKDRQFVALPKVAKLSKVFTSGRASGDAAGSAARGLNKGGKWKAEVPKLALPLSGKTDGGRSSLAKWKATGLAEAKALEDAKKPAWMRSRRVTPYKDMAYQPVALGPFDFKRVRKEVEASNPFPKTSVSKPFLPTYFEVELVAGGIRSTKRISRPGRRVYATASEVKEFLTSSLHSFGVHSRVIAESGLGCVILSTSRGVLSYRRAHALGLGGEVLCAVA
jgi:ribosomal protein S8